MQTHAVKAAEIEERWYLVDADGKTLGRLASEIAKILKGKHKPTFSPHLDMGDYVVVVNAEKVHVSGRKLEQKFYYRHSGYPKGFRSVSLRVQFEDHPERVLTRAVLGMLPHNQLGRRLAKKLKVYAGASHPHAAQKPQKLEL